jgi:hypothetical protein
LKKSARRFFIWITGKYGGIFCLTEKKSSEMELFRNAGV